MHSPTLLQVPLCAGSEVVHGMLLATVHTLLPGAHALHVAHGGHVGCVVGVCLIRRCTAVQHACRQHIPCLEVG